MPVVYPKTKEMAAIRAKDKFVSSTVSSLLESMDSKGQAKFLKESCGFEQIKDDKDFISWIDRNIKAFSIVTLDDIGGNRDNLQKIKNAGEDLAKLKDEYLSLPDEKKTEISKLLKDVWLMDPKIHSFNLVPAAGGAFVSSDGKVSKTIMFNSIDREGLMSLTKSVGRPYLFVFLHELGHANRVTDSRNDAEEIKGVSGAPGGWTMSQHPDYINVNGRTNEHEQRLTTFSPDVLKGEMRADIIGLYLSTDSAESYDIEKNKLAVARAERLLLEHDGNHYSSMALLRSEGKALNPENYLEISTAYAEKGLIDTINSDPRIVAVGAPGLKECVRNLTVNRNLRSSEQIEICALGANARSIKRR